MIVGSVDIKLDKNKKFGSILLFLHNFSLQAIQADIACHKEMIEKLAEKAVQVKDGSPRSCVAELQAHYAKLQQVCKVKMVVLTMMFFW